MIITDIVKKDNKKSIIFIDYNKAFSLYISEIKKLGLEVDEEFDENAYNKIMNEILPKRCMERAVYILKSSDKTENDLKTKLLQSDYPLDIVESVLGRLKKLSYIDDKRYSNNYIKYNIKSKSLFKIRAELYQKGIQKDMIEEAVYAYEDEYMSVDEAQIELLRKEFKKKRYDFETDDKEKLNKIYASLFRKGFKIDDIEKVYCALKEEYRNY